MHRQTKWKFYGEYKVRLKAGKSKSKSMVRYHTTYLY